jgi:hypothetical protein
LALEEWVWGETETEAALGSLQEGDAEEGKGEERAMRESERRKIRIVK